MKASGCRNPVCAISFVLALLPFPNALFFRVCSVTWLTRPFPEVPATHTRDISTDHKLPWRNKRKRWALAGGSVGWSVIPYTKRLGFDSWSGHIPRLWVQSPIRPGCVLEATDGLFFSYIDVSLSLSLINKHILRWGLNKKENDEVKRGWIHYLIVSGPDSYLIFFNPHQRTCLLILEGVREGGRGGEKQLCKRETLISCLSYVLQPRTKPAT